MQPDKSLAPYLFEVPEGWRTAPLGEIANIMRGISWSRNLASEVREAGALPVVRIGNVQSDGFHMSETLYIRDVSPRNIKLRTINDRTIVMVGSNGNPNRVGNVFLATEEVTGHLFASFLLAIKPQPEISEGFLTEVLRSPAIQAQITKSTAGSTGIKNLSLRWLRKMEVLLPPHHEQIAIASALDSLDEAVKHTEEVIAATECLRGSLLHELLSRGLPDRHTDWKQSRELGTIPACWEVVRLGDVAGIRGEQLIPASGDERPFVGLEHINNGGILNSVGRAGDSISNKTVFRAGDTLFGKLRPNLRKVVRAEFDGVCSTDILAVFGKGSADSRFVSLCLQSDQLHQHAMRGVAGTKMPRTSWRHLRQHVVGLPTKKEQRAIADVLETIDDAIVESRSEAETLRSAKESFAEVLLTGQLRADVLA